MPLSTFDGEPAVQEHYDADGNLTGTTVIPGWTDEDRAWALGLAKREANQCPRCHGDLHETLDESYQWVPQPPLKCYSCAGYEAAHKRMEKDPERRALLPVVKKVERKQPNRRR